jgi:hypothetical protein
VIQQQQQQQQQQITKALIAQELAKINEEKEK